MFLKPAAECAQFLRFSCGPLDAGGFLALASIMNSLLHFCFSPPANGAVPVHRQTGHRDRSSLHLRGEDQLLHQGQTATSPSMEASYPFPASGGCARRQHVFLPSRTLGEAWRSLQQAWSGEGISIRVSKSIVKRLIENLRSSAHF